MIQQMLSQFISPVVVPVALVWTETPVVTVLQPAQHGFSFADDEADFEQALAAHQDATGMVAPRVDANDFEKLYGWFLA